MLPANKKKTKNRTLSLLQKADLHTSLIQTANNQLLQMFILKCTFINMHIPSICKYCSFPNICRHKLLFEKKNSITRKVGGKKMMEIEFIQFQKYDNRAVPKNLQERTQLESNTNQCQVKPLYFTPKLHVSTLIVLLILMDHSLHP